MHTDTCVYTLIRKITRLLIKVFKLDTILRVSYYTILDVIYTVKHSMTIQPQNLTATQLATFNGSDPHIPIYISIKGTIFDVSSNRSMYAPGTGYSIFAGKDASKVSLNTLFYKENLVLI